MKTNSKQLNLSIAWKMLKKLKASEEDEIYFLLQYIYGEEPIGKVRGKAGMLNEDGKKAKIQPEEGEHENLPDGVNALVLDWNGSGNPWWPHLSDSERLSYFGKEVDWYYKNTKNGDRGSKAAVIFGVVTE